MADRRIPELLRIPARVRFLSAEPLLGEVDIAKWVRTRILETHDGQFITNLDVGASDTPGTWRHGVSWVIVGGESGPNARPMHPNDARKIRDQCQAAGVPFFFKQWGEHGPRREAVNMSPPYRFKERMVRVGKRNAGRLLDGREWNEVPK